MLHPTIVQRARKYPRKVWFSGSTALVKGQGLCYDSDYTAATAAASLSGAVVAATDASEIRANVVEVPTAANHLHFAGVTARAYSAVSGGQWIEIYEPGSTCEIAVGYDTTSNTTYLTFSTNTADPGRFTLPGFMGRGTALALQTNSSGNINESFAGGGTWTATGNILTLASALSATTDVSAGDKVIVLGGSTGTTRGEYTVSSVTDTTHIVLTSAISSANETDVSYYIISATTPPTVLAYLFDGEESGGQCVHAPQDNTAVLGSIAVGGVKYLPAATLGTGNSTATQADGLYFGMKTAWICLGTASTNDTAVSVTHHLTSDPEVLYFDAAAEVVFLSWAYDDWWSMRLTAATS